MKTTTPAKTSGNVTEGTVSWWQRPVLLTALLLFLVLSGLFFQSYDINKVHFSNDGPLGAMVAEQNRMPEIFTGLWVDLNWLGSEGLAPAPAITTFLRLLSPFTYARILPPASLFIVGLSACFCFRRFKLAPVACILGGLAVGLNSTFLSTSCWGVASQTVGFGAMYVALGLVAGGKGMRQWVRVVLAGLAVGIGVMEAYDIGALFSVFVAAFVVFHALFLTEGGNPGTNAGKGILRVALVAVFAAFISAQALSGLIGTQVIGVAGAQQDEKTKKEVWPEMTRWSLPKAEVLQVFVPGFFGYRNTWHMYDSDQPGEDQYWGLIGVDPNVDMAREMLKNPNPEAQAQAESYLKNPQILWRLIGTGFYAGVPVVVIALWAMAQAFRGERSPFTLFQRRAIMFWSGATVISLLLSFGKYAPFYQLFYALPYASAIRNPDKFMHVFTWALLIVFAYGVHGLAVKYLKSPAQAEGSPAPKKSWWSQASVFERGWLGGSVAAVVLAFMAWAVYAQNAKQLEAYLLTVAIPADIAPKVAEFSIHALGWFVLLLALTVGLLALIFSGKFSGERSCKAGWMLGALIVFDLARAGSPWIVYQDVPYKYVSDPIIQFLADKPYEHRVAMLPVGGGDQMSLLSNAYGSYWKQAQFFYNNIQCADVVQEPRVSADKGEFSSALPANSLFNILRFWELSNTRYILGPGGDFVSKQLDPSGKLFHVVRSFNFTPRKPNPVTSVDFISETNATGDLAVIEFTGALPRAKLFANWQVSTNDTNTLQAVASQNFDPHALVLVANASVPATNSAATGQDAGTVEITNYKAKTIELSADVKTASVLLLSERYSPKWTVTVDGKPAELLRCDFILKGVFLSPGKHTVVFHFAPPLTALYVSLTAIGIGVALIGWLAVSKKDEEKDEDRA